VRSVYLTPYEDAAAMAVLRQIDGADREEALRVTPALACHYTLFAAWRGMAVLPGTSQIAMTRRCYQPFAVFAASPAGAQGVASVSLLSRDHARFRRELAELTAHFRARLPELMEQHGIHRLEVRSWADHPRAAGLLRAMGFQPEATCRGFGAEGADVFVQWAQVRGAA
jgi:hypothetical protein